MLPPPASSSRRDRLERSVLALVLAAALALAAAALPARIAWLVQLAGSGDVRARGALAADEHVSPLATAGQVRWRRELARQPPRASGMAAAWTFFVGARAHVAPGDSVFLARPNDLLYEYGNFLLYPARVEVTPAAGARLAGGADLAAAAAGRTCAEREWLRAAGYSACIEARGAGLFLVPVGGAIP